MAAAALAAPQRAMPDLLLHADKGLRGIARTGGTLLGADCSTEKMPAAIRLSFAGDADGLATLADRHGVPQDLAWLGGPAFPPGSRLFVYVVRAPRCAQKSRANCARAARRRR